MNSNPEFKVVVMLDGLILKGMTAKASLRMYLILKSQTTLPGLEIKRTAAGEVISDQIIDFINPT